MQAQSQHPSSPHGPWGLEFSPSPLSQQYSADTDSPEDQVRYDTILLESLPFGVSLLA